MQAIVYLALAVFGSVGAWVASDAAAGDLATFVVIYEPGPTWKPGVAPGQQPGVRDHGRYMQRLFDDGVMQSAGPLDGGGGMMLIRARDEAAVRAVVEADPGVQSGLLVLGMLRRWEPRDWGKA